MKITAQFELMARYNRWMNQKIFAAVAKIPPERLFHDRGAFFGSIGGTLNHILVGDIIWIKRFLNHPTRFQALLPISSFDTPTSLDQRLYQDLDSLVHARRNVDQILVDFCDELTCADLDHNLSYSNISGERFTRPFDLLLLHLFNHQTHHRGQTTTLLSQLKIDPGVTDLLELIPRENST